jgi:SAM domain (Sterile alpha motif)
MQEIADWLRGLGFEQYVRCFAENDIEPSISAQLFANGESPEEEIEA